MEGRLVRILLVEDHAVLARTWLRWLRAVGHPAQSTDSLAGAKAALLDALEQHQPYDIILLDLVLTDGSGLDLIGFVLGIRPPPAVVVISGHIDAACALTLQRHRIEFLPKPVAIDVLLGKVQDLTTPDDLDVVASFCGSCHLSTTETERVRRAANYEPNHVIDEQLGQTQATGRNQWKRIEQKTGCRSQRDVMAALFHHAQRRKKG